VSGFHHVVFEVAAGKLAEEKLFWNLLGYGETAPLSRARPKLHWLVDRASGSAIMLQPVGSPTIPEWQCLGILVDDFQRRARSLNQFGYLVQPVEDYFGRRRAYTLSPSGHNIEIIEPGPTSIVAGPTETRRVHI
jgi:hypothetical protein